MFTQTILTFFLKARIKSGNVLVLEANSEALAADIKTLINSYTVTAVRSTLINGPPICPTSSIRKAWAARDGDIDQRLYQRL